MQDVQRCKGGRGRGGGVDPGNGCSVHRLVISIAVCFRPRIARSHVQINVRRVICTGEVRRLADELTAVEGKFTEQQKIIKKNLRLPMTPGMRNLRRMGELAAVSAV